MANFQTSVDVANRALQHCGSSRITAFTDDTKQAQAVAFCYDKLREAELRRNVWGFSVRKAALRPIDSTFKQLAPAAWSNVTTYPQGAVVSYLGEMWESTAAGNVGQTPGADASAWEMYAGPVSIRPFTLNTGATASDVAYYSGELVVGNGSTDTTTVYRSLITGNSDIPPSANWLSLGTVSAALTILYPIGAGPSNDMDTRNVFILPAAYLRQAPTDPKAGNVSYLGAPHNLIIDDWTFEDGMLVSATADLIVFRFVASVTKVTKMDPMFCEGVACRIGLEICEELTQSAEKLQTIGASYKTFMGEARTVNAIEQGPVESPEDDWIACRI